MPYLLHCIEISSKIIYNVYKLGYLVFNGGTLSRYSKIALIKKEAKVVLFKNYPKCIAISSGLLFFVSGIISITEYIYTSLSGLFDKFTTNLLFVYYSVLCLFTISPIVFIIFSYLVLPPKTSKVCDKYNNYKLSVVIALIYVLIFLYLTVAPVVFDKLASYVMIQFDNVKTLFVYTISKTILCFIFLLIYFLSIHFLLNFVLLYYTYNKYNATLYNLVKLSRICIKHRKMDYFVFNISFLPLFLVCYYLFPLFVLLFLPYYFISANNFAKYCIENADINTNIIRI